ncbi:hypothetical protein IMZ48_18805 [Candidatus Bathyarchaeota archaeon]|nr:hypothetical protein [Candidatus Bathyarchaeota archaeon]
MKWDQPPQKRAKTAGSDEPPSAPVEDVSFETDRHTERRGKALLLRARDDDGRTSSDSNGTEVQELPNCQGQPPVWADMRQSLNSALPWHKGYQSGDYTRDNVLLGCLLDGFPEERDTIDPSGVIIMNM